jgi:hypothetical protein
MAAPPIEMPWLAIVLAVIWNFILGFVWYMPQVPTGKVWMRAQNLPANHKPLPGEMLKGILLMVVGAVLTMGVLAYLIHAMQHFYDSPLDWMSGAWAGFFVWLGFALPICLGGLAWERKTVGYTAVNAGYHLVSLVVGGIIIATMA